jgi:hypothetical protein
MKAVLQRLRGHKREIMRGVAHQKEKSSRASCLRDTLKYTQVVHAHNRRARERGEGGGGGERGRELCLRDNLKYTHVDVHPPSGGMLHSVHTQPTHYPHTAHNPLSSPHTAQNPLSSRRNQATYPLSLPLSLQCFRPLF